MTTHALTLPRDLPDIASATLPDTYERAQVALRDCDRVDECKSWADKMAALASYAKQADDTTLHRLAVRIQARAVRRAGELLREFDARGAHRRTEDVRGSSQRQVAATAGMSEHQQLQAVRVANVPAEEFESALERDDPPTVTALAERGTTKRPAAPGVADATKLLGMLRELAQFCEEHAPADVVVGLFAHEPKQIHEHLKIIGAWVEDFTNAMGERYAHEPAVHRQSPASRNSRPVR